MRAVHFCRTCDFRLPYCVRTDRRYCSQRCRIWDYRHPGWKRPDFSPRTWGLPDPLGRGRPKTLKEALRALAEARDYAAKLEAAAKAQQIEVRRLRDRLAELRDEVGTANARLTADRDAVQAELEKAHQRLVEIEQQAKDAVAQSKSYQERADALTARLKMADEAVAEQQAGSERLTRELAELRQADTKRAEEISKLTTEAAALATRRDELVAQNAELTKAREELREQAREEQRRATEREAALAQARGELSTLRQAHDQQAHAHNQEIGKLRSETVSLTRSRDELAERNKILSAHTEGLRIRAEAAEKTVVQREEELNLQRRNFAAAEKAHQEIHVVAESGNRSLNAERERRIALEGRVEQLAREIENLTRASRPPSGNDQLSLFGPREETLWAELREVRIHRDEAIAERELLAARLLRWMSPGQYLEHATAAGYDITKDPLIQLKREEVLVESRLADWQTAKKKRRRARPLDPSQSITEQAYAAALSFRWKQMNHPHLRRKQRPTWRTVGFLLDPESEKYLLTLTRERIEDLKRKIVTEAV